MEFKTVYTIINYNNEQKLLGVHNINLKLFEDFFGFLINYRSLEFSIPEDKSEEMFVKVMNFFEDILNHGINLEYRDFQYILHHFHDDEKSIDILRNLFLYKDVILTNNSGRQIYPRTINQKKYVSMLKNKDIVFGVGPAGTGKTFLAVNYAVSLLKNNHVKKIVLVRPVVEAGEKLGFLPGDLKDKIDPYLIPLYDALYDALGKDKVDLLVEKGVIEVCPLAYMRGRTLENATIILDEAQNTTTSQMKMFLTRLGFNSKMFVTGDVTQIDLDKYHMSGLVEALKILRGIDGIGFTEFDKQDVMRHPLVHEIIKRYEEKNND